MRKATLAAKFARVVMAADAASLAQAVFYLAEVWQPSAISYCTIGASSTVRVF